MEATRVGALKRERTRLQAKEPELVWYETKVAG